MDASFLTFISEQSTAVLILVIAVLIFVLGKGADILVDQAVFLSLHWGIPKMLVGATIVSLGTTLPEAAVSVFAAARGNPGIALGNAVGSIICDTGLVLGMASLLSPLPLKREIVNRQGWIQFGAGVLLVLSCFPWSSPAAVFTTGGRLPQFMGFVFLALLACYMVATIRWARRSHRLGRPETVEKDSEGGTLWPLVKLVGGAALVLASSHFLIPAVEETAARLSVPDSIISATLVAFGTSLPELVTAITAVRKRVGELAVGNIIGADILNVLFVAGAAASVTGKGLAAPPQFFSMLFPAMLFILAVFRVGIFISKDRLKRSFGAVLLAIYVGITTISYF